jgi:hypothetical protein
MLAILGWMRVDDEYFGIFWDDFFIATIDMEVSQAMEIPPVLIQLFFSDFP